MVIVLRVARPGKAGDSGPFSTTTTTTTAGCILAPLQVMVVLLVVQHTGGGESNRLPWVHRKKINRAHCQ